MAVRVKDIFTAEVHVQYTTPCEHCDFGHRAAEKHTSEEFESYSDALEAGIAFATKHGGGTVTVHKVTGVDCGTGVW